MTTHAGSGFALRTESLAKTYRTRKGPHRALAGLDLRVPLGGVHGFLGPNGSGKTTTIRIALGLVRADAGRVLIFDQPIPERLPTVIGRVGAIVEQPKFFPAFSGRKNLALLAQGIGVPASRVEAVLADVGLADRARDKFKTYSLGMKQRLAVAGTLLKDPDLLIFDEPTNGLDPAGIRQVRATMRGLAERGKTILISSHILSEVQQVADTVSIIGRGSLLAQGRVSEILADVGPAVALTARVRVREPQRAAEILRAGGFQAIPNPDGSLEVTAPAARPDVDPAEITHRLADQGLYVAELQPRQADLEAAFLRLTEDRR